METKKWTLAGHENGIDLIHDYPENIKMASYGGIYTSIGPWFPTKEELFEKKKIPATPCKECGSFYSTTYNHKNLAEVGMCFACDHWTERKNSKIVIDGHVYSDGGKVDKSKTQGFLGFGGRDFKIEMFDGSVIETNNLWSGGKIPERFKSRIPDTAKFI